MVAACSIPLSLSKHYGDNRGWRLPGSDYNSSPLTALERRWALSGICCHLQQLQHKACLQPDLEKQSRTLQGRNGAPGAKVCDLTLKTFPYPQARLGEKIQKPSPHPSREGAPSTEHTKWKGRPALRPMGLKGIKTSLDAVRTFQSFCPRCCPLHHLIHPLL